MDLTVNNISDQPENHDLNTINIKQTTSQTNIFLKQNCVQDVVWSYLKSNKSIGQLANSP